MKSLNPKVWAILSEDEKTALGLQNLMDKSSWEAGEIMSKSHYKYLEIKYRAEKFLKTFSEYFALYDELLPDYIKGEEAVLKYFRFCIEKRITPGRALDLVNQECNLDLKKTQLNKKIIKVFDVWQNEDNIHEFQAYNLIKDFDRWNNFRILPKELQEPSAFKRRIKNKYKRHVKLLSSIPFLSVEKIKKVCSIQKNSHYVYLPLINNHKPEIIKVRDSKRVIGLLTSISLYVFKEKLVAQEYIEAVSSYTSKRFRECTDGLVFWPKYREFIKKAYNYNEIQNISTSRKYLDLALKNLHFL